MTATTAAEQATRSQAIRSQADYIRLLIEQAPPLSDEQRAAIQVLIQAARRAS